MLWSIPACAGEPLPRCRQSLHRKVYPRVCGGTVMVKAFSRQRNGLSPRVRGNHALLVARRAYRRSIPACAGEPGSGQSVGQHAKVYPRVCGGTPVLASGDFALRGLSPRVRGNPAAASPRRNDERSIPACAGEPKPQCMRSYSFGVYPRVCGGTQTSLRYQPDGKVYPRVCGGTTMTRMDRSPSGGLSPRVRGNPTGYASLDSRGGSIPACAGEPRRVKPASAFIRVYPRVCGGTNPPIANRLRRWGLSPRVRGNRINAN